MSITNNHLCWINDNNKEGSGNRWKYVINKHYMKGGFMLKFYDRLRKIMRNTVLITHNKYDKDRVDILIDYVINSNTPDVKLLRNYLKG